MQILQSIDLTAHVVAHGMRVDAKFDRFVLFAGVWGILGCHSFEIRGISRDLKTSCHLAVTETSHRADYRDNYVANLKLSEVRKRP